jgi:uncharacterized SAM-binding protein YcdF (DUF218 family)
MLFATIMPASPQKTLRFWALFLTSLFVLVAFLLFNLGNWLVREDPLQHAAAIAVLNGRMPDRALEAARLYNSGNSPQVWLTHSAEPAATLQRLSIPYAGEESYDKLLLIHQGVPENAIRVIDPPIINTADEIRAISAALAQTQSHRVIIVTSKVHTRRTGILWKKLAPKEEEAIIRGVSDDEFDPTHWWKSTGDALDVVRELLGILNAWAGLPLQPAK